MMQFIKECLFPSLVFTVCGVLIILFIFLMIDALNSVVRAADALERIADVLEGDDEDEEDVEEDKEEGGAK